jgi:hypothetical protein
MTEPHDEIHGRDIIARVVQSGHIDYNGKDSIDDRRSFHQHRSQL